MGIVEFTFKFHYFVLVILGPCTTGVSSCSGGVCTCKAGYTGPDCCDCAPGYYKATDGTCKREYSLQYNKRYLNIW